MREETRLSMLRLLGARSLMLRILVASAEPDSSILFSQLSAELKQLDDEHIPHILQKFNTDGKQSDRPCNILVPLDAVERLREAHQSGQLKTIARLAKSLSHSSYPDSDCIQMLRASPCLETLPIPERDTPVSFKNFLLRATTCGESLAIISAICSSMYTIQSKSHTVQKKNKKKCNKKIESEMINETNESKVIIALFLKKLLL